MSNPLHSPADEHRRWTGDINYAGLAAATEYFEVNREVSFRRTNGRRTRGAHRIRNGAHYITVSTYLTVEEANRTILHELAHAAQADRVGNDLEFHVAYRRENAARGYANNKFEVEARAASEFSADFRVAR